MNVPHVNTGTAWASPRRLQALAIALAVTVLALFPLVSDNAYYQNMAIMAFLLAVMASGWNIISGYTGYISLGQSAFLGIGAYTTALLSIHLGWSPLLAAPVGGLTSAAAALLLGLVGRRTRGIAFVIVSFAFLEFAALLVSNWSSVTKGNHGLALPLPSWDRDLLNIPFYYALLVLLVLTVWGSWAIRRSTFGIGLLAIRDDESKADGVGVRTDRYKMLAFAASALPIGIAGGVYGYYISFLEPAAMFDIVIAMQILLAAHLGGVGTLWGPVLGAFLLEPLNQFTNQTLSGPDAGSWRMIMYGTLLAVIVLFLPRGIITESRAWLSRRRGTAPRARAGVRLTDVPATLPAPSLPRPTGELPSGEPLLRVTGLGKAFGGVKAVDDCSFTVREGSVTGLIGPNGSGKTTVFNLLDGGLGADSGTIELAGRRIDRLPRWRRAHSGLARTFQATRVFPRLTALENLAVPSRSYSARGLRAGVFTGEEAERAQEWLEFVGMGAYSHHLAGELSYGQQKLIELAQALVLEPRLLLLDEPAAGINPALVERISDIVRKLNAAGTTVVIVEHNMPLVLSLCDHIHVLARGRVIASGPPREIERDPAVLDAYLGDNQAAMAGTTSGANR
ncbi:branched-chain amino acid ABC transporter ATP-binding protein/permease [Streptomyces sp. 4R-3d]|uniref:branched-chain amino acid ABC transporter ATP-binding protein/permease n=1 Tax=Streptomyces sp. 4R-3d TaxID=2559605 RepID=UPI0010721302|nr:branched-chain amino acid ABC transporter ATP-binding protein/permease [Streptomyces sp. 4R-3d]TFI23067.1 branched-chain amino acid ABC transporter ATP-binding protein/permease [Streptomyces sp. 4R-3d]